MERKIPIEVSARHIHLSQRDLDALFGEKYQLKIAKQLTQPCDFAADEKIGVLSDSGQTITLRIVGPTRSETQIELSLTDAFNLGIEAPIRNSGNLDKTPGITLIGPEGKIKIARGVVVQQRHIHCNPTEAKKLGIKQGNLVSVKTNDERAVTFHNTFVRVSENYRLCLHLDTDEGNAAGISKTGQGVII